MVIQVGELGAVDVDHPAAGFAFQAEEHVALLGQIPVAGGAHAVDGDFGDGLVLLQAVQGAVNGSQPHFFASTLQLVGQLLDGDISAGLAADTVQHALALFCFIGFPGGHGVAPFL